MFTGIIEATGKIISARKEKSNLILEIESPFTHEIKVDQSIAHNGVCLTVTEISGKNYFVTAIEETLNKSNLGSLKQHDLVNLERCMQMGGRLDGHIVQGHVDGTAICERIMDHNGSKEFFFRYETEEHVTVPKGSITVNGVSLTVVHSGEKTFSVAIIPYTFDHTNFKDLKAADRVNLEFDIIGKYVQRLMMKQ